MMLFAAFFALIFVIYAQGNVSACLYTQRFHFFSTTASRGPGTYSISIPWRSVQIIVDSSIALTGFQVATSILLRYDAQLANVTTTDTQVVLKIDAGSQISAISFQVILTKPCSGSITLRNILFYPTVLYLVSRAIHRQTTDVFLSQPFGINTNLYLSQVFFTSFAFTSTLDRIVALQFKTLPIVAGQNYQTVEFGSDYNVLNRIFRIRFCYLMIDLSTFTNLAYYNTRLNTESFSASISTTNVNIPSVFNPYLSQKCIVALYSIWTKDIANSATQVTIIETGAANISTFSSIIGANMNGVGFTSLCVQECPPETYVNYTASPSTCFQHIPKCLIQASNITCAQCVSNYFLYNNNSNCSLTCPSNQYGNTTTYTCESCLSECLTCYDDSSCQRCRSGIFVNGGCTDVAGCIQVVSYINDQCISCQTNLHFELFNGTCVCQNGYRLVTYLCTNVTGCIVVSKENNSTTCTFCDVCANLTISNGSCICITGFYMNDSNMCTQICGDGILLSLSCDDGNTEDGDGCSSTCSVEKFYRCVNGFSSNPSQCVYAKKDISLSLTRNDRGGLDNIGIFKFKILPALINYKKINIVQSINFECNQSIQIGSITLEGNQLTVTITFNEDLEENEAKLLLSLNSSYFSQTNVSLSFKMISDGMKLILLKDIVRLNFLEESIKILGQVILGLFFLSFFVHKMMGVEMINSFQVIYFVHLINPSYTAPYSLVKLLFPTVFNFLYYNNNISNIYSTKQHIIFSKDNQQFTLLLINGVSIGLILTLVVLRAIILLSQKNDQSIQQKLCKKRLKHILIASEIIYKYTIFPFFIGTFLVTTLLQKRQRQLIQKSYQNLLSDFLQLILTSLVFFYQQKMLFVDLSMNRGFVGLSRCYKRFISIYITFLLIIAMILKFAYKFEDIFNSELLLSIAYIIFLTCMVAAGPYQAFIHNAGLVSSLVVTLYFLIWSSLKRFNIISQSEQQQIILLSFLLILVFVSLTVTLLRIIHQCRLKWHKIFSKKETKQSVLDHQKKEEKLCNKPNCKSLLHEQQVFIKISKDAIHRYNEIETSLFVPSKRKATTNEAQQTLKKKSRAQFRKRFKAIQKQQLRDELF